MTVLDISPGGYALAARTIGGEIATVTAYAAEFVGERAAGCYGMAGSDDIGAGWGVAYDQAADAAMSATTAAADAALCLAALLEQTGINYLGAEAASVPGESAAQSEMRWAHSSAPAAPVLPSAVGFGLPEPAGWSMLQHAIGRVWPNGHQDHLRTAADAWRGAAEMLGQLLPHYDLAMSEVAMQRGPEVDAALAVMEKLRDDVVGLGKHYRDLGAACEDYAHHLDAAHSAILRECVEFVDVTIAAEAAGGLFAVVTAGLSEVAANSAVAVAAVRIGRTIADVIDALAGAVVSLAAELDAAAAGVAVVERDLAPVLAMRVEQAEFVRPGVLGQVAPVVGTSPTDIAVARLTRSYGPSKILAFVDEPKYFNPKALRGMELDDLRARIPSDWGVRPSKSGGGTVYEDPVHRGRVIRLMPGYPAHARPDPLTHGPYVEVSQNGKEMKVALAGNPTLK